MKMWMCSIKPDIEKKALAEIKDDAVFAIYRELNRDQNPDERISWAEIWDNTFEMPE